MPTREDAIDVVFLEEVTPLGEFEFNIARQKREQCLLFHNLYRMANFRREQLLQFQFLPLFSVIYLVTLLAYSTFLSLLTHHTAHLSLTMHMPIS